MNTPWLCGSSFEKGPQWEVGSTRVPSPLRSKEGPTTPPSRGYPLPKTHLLQTRASQVRFSKHRGYFSTLGLIFKFISKTHIKIDVRFRVTVRYSMFYFVFGSLLQLTILMPQLSSYHFIFIHKTSLHHLMPTGHLMPRGHRMSMLRARWKFWKQVWGGGRWGIGPPAFPGEGTTRLMLPPVPFSRPVNAPSNFVFFSPSALQLFLFVYVLKKNISKIVCVQFFPVKKSYFLFTFFGDFLPISWVLLIKQCY